MCKRFRYDFFLLGLMLLSMSDPSVLATDFFTFFFMFPCIFNVSTFNVKIDLHEKVTKNIKIHVYIFMFFKVRNLKTSTSSYPKVIV